MPLARHTKANREFFEPNCGPTKDTWRAWVKDGIVKGKLVGNDVFVDLNWFAANDIMTYKIPEQSLPSGIDLLS